MHSTSIPSSSMDSGRVHIRRVGKHNFDEEMEIIENMITFTPFDIVTIDTEYPGVVVSSDKHEDRNPEAEYMMMKVNVNCMSLIQVGLTLSDHSGRLPILGGDNRRVVWEFAISDFDIDDDTTCKNQTSIDMLRSRGLDFEFNRREGIDSQTFAEKMLDIGLLMSQCGVKWITFHGAYDFAYLIKAVTREKLPKKLEEFQELVQLYFGEDVLDLKYMLRFHPVLFGGLEAIAAKIGVQRISAPGHQAGADSLLTQMVFEKLKKEYFGDIVEVFKKDAGHIYPLA
ncbi:hypothetical protein QQ045_010406 [Rhodiola kirilowii]